MRVDRMAEERATKLICFRAAPLDGVVIRTARPMGFHRGHENFAQRPGGREMARFGHAVAKTDLKDWHEHAPGPGRNLCQRIGFGDRPAQGLLTNHMLAGFQRATDRIKMQERRQANVDDVDIRARQQRLIVIRMNRSTTGRRQGGRACHIAVANDRNFVQIWIGGIAGDMLGTNPGPNNGTPISSAHSRATAASPSLVWNRWACPCRTAARTLLPPTNPVCPGRRTVIRSPFANVTYT